MKKKGEDQQAGKPVIRLRRLVLVVGVVILILIGPFMLVWKQVFITDASMRIERINDTLSALDKQIAGLSYTCEKLSATDRIETIAREALGLEYPASDRIVIVPVDPDVLQGSNSKNRVLPAIFRRLFDRGGTKG